MIALAKKEPFLECEQPWEFDKLGRQNIAEYLTPVIGSIRQPFVISLNSPYGTGKTFFIKNWQAQLLKDGYKAVYFNAWETDYADDALVAFISSIREQIAEISDSKNKAKLDKLAALVKKAEPYLSKNILPAMAKILMRLAVGGKIAEDIEGELTDLTGNLAKQSLERHENIKQSIEDFKDYLAEVVKDLTADADHGDKKKLIIFVDELDRCRPHYAIEVLECIKHLFSVEGLVFILAIDEEQIKSSIACVYGIKQNGEGYLNKFIDWQLKMPEPSYKEYTTFLFDSFGLQETRVFTEDNNIFKGKTAFIESFSLFAEMFKLTPRQQGKCFTDINLLVRSLPKGHSPLSHVLGLVSVLRSARPDEARDYCLKEKPVEGLMDFLEPLVKTESLRKVFGAWNEFQSMLHVWSLDDRLFNAFEEKYHEVSKQFNATGAVDFGSVKHTALEKDLKYHQRVMSIWDGYSRTISMGDGSMLENTYMRLEKASFLNVNGL